MDLTKLTYKVFTLILLLVSFNVNSQECNGNTFTNPGQPATCTYTYTASGWLDSSGDAISAPTSTTSTESICILSDFTGDFDQVKGAFYVPEGVTYTGGIFNFTDADVIIEGTANITPTTTGNNNNFIDSGTDIVISQTGDLSLNLSILSDIELTGSGVINNAGSFTIGSLSNTGTFTTGGQTVVNNYSGGIVTVYGDTKFENQFNNCGLLEIATGELHTTGGSNLLNFCTIYVHYDLVLDQDFTNDVLLIVDGDIISNGGVIYNNGKLLVNNLILDNDQIIGDYENSMLIVRNSAILNGGSSLTGHYFYNVSGSGIDYVCDTCVADVDIIDNATVPNPLNDLQSNCGDDIIINPIEEVSTLDFDGIDDYAEQLNVNTDNTLNSDTIIEGLDQYTVSFWFKYQGDMITNNDKVFVMGQKGVFEVYIGDWSDTENVNQTIGAFLYKSDGLPQGSGWRFDPTSWTHLTVTVDNTGSGSTFRVFRNGYGTSGSTIATSTTSNSNPFRIAIPNGSTSYKNFEGWIDEVRIFDTVLTDDQIQQLVYQEIEDHNGNVRGTVVPKDIEDFTTGSELSWNNLQAYYPMTKVISKTRTDDYSGNSNALKLYNIDTFQPQTAPMPYETISDGDWNNESTWLHGDVWDIESLDSEYGTSNQNPEQWSIVKVHHDVTSNSSRRNLGMFIDTNKTLTINGDNSVTNNWYLQLDGALDLQNDSQLIQTINSDLVTSDQGKILRRQKGNSNYFWYNYWCSPVGSIAATSLTDNNSGNNSNNTPFRVNMLKDETGTAMDFTSSYHQSGRISTYWLYTFQNGITYWDWTSLNQNSDIQPGFGYTQKGTGTSNDKQEYIFEGKPNNGTILIAADDVDGDNGESTESEQNTTLTTTLIGNPYPSALDARKFIEDNSSVIGGTIMLWEQWAGNSHILNEYEGGYAFINKLSTVRAYQHADIPIADQTQNRGIKQPTGYLPVGQGFFVEVIEDGQIEFNNSQRVFKKENAGESIFFRTSEEQASTEADEDESSFQLVRLEFATSQGTTRRFVLGFGEDATEGFDNGYDGGVIRDLPADDMGSLLNGEQYVIQALSPITSDKVVDLNFNASGNYTYSLKAVEFENLPENQEIYLKDNVTGDYFDLKNGGQYDFTSDAGEFADRFDIVFQSGDTLSAEEFSTDNTVIFINQLENKLFVKQLTDQAKQLSIFNMTGQTIRAFNNLDNNLLENGLDVSNLSTGVYLVNIKTENNIQISKKIILE